MKQIKNIRNFLLISLIAGGTWIGCDDAIAHWIHMSFSKKL